MSTRPRDVCCASGGFYRFFHKTWPSLAYKGFDISETAIRVARSCNPTGDFQVYDGSFDSSPDIPADIVFSRDVAHHQKEPREFIANLYGAARRYLLLRVRTRETGATVFDPSKSGQYTNGHWVPFIVFNTSEMIDLFRSFSPAPKSITVWRHPDVLGGYNGRFLPKDLYYQETGTAQTAVLVEKGSDSDNQESVVTLEDHPETHQADWWYRLARKVVRR